MVSSATTPPASRWRLDAQELAAWRGLLRVHARLTRELDVELQQAHGLSLSAYDVLVQLSDAPDHRLRMAELADSILLSPSGLTRLVDRMCRDGLLERERCESDARGSFAVLAGLGRERLAEARPTHLAGVRRLFCERFSATELKRLAAYWERLATATG